MTRNWPTVLALVVGFCLGLAFESRGPVGRSEAKASTSPQDPQLAALKAEVQTIKDRLPDQAHAMQDVANQFTNVWFAEGKRHWELTNFYLGETRNHLRWAVRIIPKRKDSAGKDVDLIAILQSVENGPLKQVEAAIKSQDHDRFVVAYRFTLESCYACHKAASKPYLRPQIPTGPGTQIVNFDPNANWPL
ncbi:MAG TPA: hypothetical protein VEI07_00890 [Planctomycetaceae bacterium]|nr:hypothetical protein [Planctomycetaceae bacterium]